MSQAKYEAVIGIETHVQLATKSKLFCGCNNDSREAAPNTHVCPVCLGLPGALPVLNHRAVELSLQAGQALNAYDGNQKFASKFDRKNYFYPDSPMNYQITQFDQPLVGGGWVILPDGKKIGVTRAHLEADAGKLTHPDGADYSLVDLNRAGTPLLEIVSEPDITSAEEAKAYARELYLIMRAAGVSDADLYHGNMRFDVNVSLRPAGAKEFGTRTETKNLNSFRAVQGAVTYEIERQSQLLDEGKKVVQETRGWDDAAGKTYSQRSKEEAHDYRYFPEPDLPPLQITTDMLSKAAAELGTLPAQYRDSFAQAGIDKDITETLIEGGRAWWLEGVIKIDTGAAGRVANWLASDIPTLFEASQLKAMPTAAELVEVAKMTDAGDLSSTNAKRLLGEIMEGQAAQMDLRELAQKLKLIQVSDSGQLEEVVDRVISENPGPVKDYLSGNDKVLGFLVGQVMKASGGQANPPMVNGILKEKLGGLNQDAN